MKCHYQFSNEITSRYKVHLKNMLKKTMSVKSLQHQTLPEVIEVNQTQNFKTFKLGSKTQKILFKIQCEARYCSKSNVRHSVSRDADKGMKINIKKGNFQEKER
jgi:hypothetical protein